MNNKAPMIQLSMRNDINKNFAWMIRIASFVIAILIAAIIILCIGENPVESFGIIVTGSLGKASGIRQTVKYAIPLLGTALALAPCFKMRYWNIGAEGQITAGAMAAAFFAITFPTMSKPILLIVMALAGAIFGGLWSAIPAVFKAKWGTNETLFTLMMNYIIIGIVKWLQGGPWEGKPGSQIIPMFSDNAVLPKLCGIYCGWVFVVLLVVAVFAYMKYTKQGYEIAVIGSSVNTARYVGMNVKKIIIRTAFLSGAICGIVGYMVASGAHNTLYADVAAGVGFTAITVAWLAQLNPFAMVAISVLMGVLEKGASSLQTALGVPTSISDIIVGIFLFSMLAGEFFIRFKITLRKNDKEAEQ